MSYILLHLQADGMDKILGDLATAPDGSRAWPNQSKDHIISFRVDYGKSYLGEDGRPFRDLVLQANKDTKNPRVAAIADKNPHQVLARVAVPVDNPLTDDEFVGKLTELLR